jgi:hypothetical protein
MTATSTLTGPESGTDYTIQNPRGQSSDGGDVVLTGCVRVPGGVGGAGAPLEVSGRGRGIAPEHDVSTSHDAEG